MSEKSDTATLCTYSPAIWSGSPNGTWPRTMSFSLHSAITTARFAVLQEYCCSALHPGLCELKQQLKPVELVAEATDGRRVASQLHSCGQVHKWQL
jgi:hypothetical protein